MVQIILFFLLMTVCMLLHPEASFQHATIGLTLWFERMIPTLLPFMILSSTAIKLGVSDKIASLFHPLLRVLFKGSKNVSFGLFMGFLCGFPMGARIAADLYENHLISKREAEFLLYISNNIGPIYFCTFALPLIGQQNVPLLLLGMYGIPLIYGIILRYTRFQDMDSNGFADTVTAQKKLTFSDVLLALNDAVNGSVKNMLSLGGYMILFHLLNLIPELFLKENAIYIYPMVEITGGLVAFQDVFPIYSLVMLSFGGLCCLTQTYSCIAATDLSISKYAFHKSVIALLSLMYYTLIFTF